MPKIVTPPPPQRDLPGRRSWPRPVKTPSQLIQPPVLIGWFDGLEFDFLSNFHPSPISARDNFMWMDFPTVEHAFQAAKMQTESWRVAVATVKDPGVAKHLGRTGPMRADWDAVKYQVMYDLLKVKFTPGSRLAGLLVDTFPAELVEGNSWNDRVWGVDWRTGRGENWLGELLMQVRAELLEADRV